MTVVPVRTNCKSGFLNITGIVQKTVTESGMQEGACLVFVPHTTAGITVNEGADPAVQTDMLSRFDKLSPQDPGYLHAEGNSPAHVKASIAGSSVTIPVSGGKLVLGTWQTVYFCEFDGPRDRQLTIQLLKAF